MSKRRIRKLRHRSDFKSLVSAPLVNNLQVTPKGAADTIIKARAKGRP